MLGFVPHPNLNFALRQEPHPALLLAMPLLESAYLLARGVAHKKVVRCNSIAPYIFVWLPHGFFPQRGKFRSLLTPYIFSFG